MKAHDLRADGERAAAGDGADKQQRRGFGRNAERIEREYTAEREADEDNEDADVFEYDGEPAISELTGVCRDILTAVEGLTSLLRDEFDYAG